MRLCRYGKDAADGEEEIVTDELLSLRATGGRGRAPWGEVSLEANRPVTQRELGGYLDRVGEYYDLGVRLVRARDPGVIRALVGQFYDLRVILDFELGGPHNLDALLAWRDTYGERIHRALLSNEIPLKSLEEIQKSLGLPIELPLWGPVLLYHSPRRPLPRDGMFRVKNLDFQAHHSMAMSQGPGGSLLYSSWDLSLLDQRQELQNIGITFGKVDTRGLGVGPRRTFRGFFKANKTRSLFPKLKNQNLPQGLKWQGEVLEVVKGSHMVVRAMEGPLVALGAEVEFWSPDGRRALVVVKSWEAICEGAGLYLTSVVRGVSTGAKMLIRPEKVRRE